MDGGTCWATVRGVTKSQTRPSDFTLPYLTETETGFPSSTAGWPIPHLPRDGPAPGSEGERTTVQGLGVRGESGHTGDVMRHRPGAVGCRTEGLPASLESSPLP